MLRLTLVLLTASACTAPDPILSTERERDDATDPSAEGTPFRRTTRLAVPEVDRDLHQVFADDLPGRVCNRLTGFGVSAGDLDGDGDDDLAVANCDQVFLYESHGDLTFTRHALDLRSTDTDDAVTIWIADLDRDGLNDLVYGGFDGLAVWHNQGGYVFDHTTNHGIVPREGNFPSTLSLMHIDDDPWLDLHVGYAGPDFAGAIERGGDTTEPHHDDFYRGTADGTFEPIPVDRPHGWYTLHTIPLDEGFVVLEDIGRPGGPQSSHYVYSEAEDQLVRTPFEDVFGFIEAPMGGFFDHVTDPHEPEMWVSDHINPRAYQREEGLWFDRAQKLGVHDPGFTWSIVPDDIDLDGLVDVYVSAGHPAVTFTDEPIDEGQLFGVSRYDQGPDGLSRSTFSEGHNVVGLTLADLDGDGGKEVVLRHNRVLDGGANGLEVWRAQSSVPRVAVRLDASCYGEELDYAGLSRRFQPFNHSGSFGNGSHLISFPWRVGDDEITIGRDRRVPVERNHVTEGIRCDR